MASAALDRARTHLLGLQQPAGWWKGELQTNVTMDAEDLLLREFLGIRTAAETEQAARWIRSQQRADGTWANFEGGPADLSTTLEAYVALKLAGDDPDAAHMRAAVTFIRGQGGVERSRVFTRLWLALFGLWSWDDLPNLPPELIFLPKWFPFNVYDFGCWARQTIVPLTIVATLRPVRPLPVGIDELRTGAASAPTAPLRSWRGAFQRLDRGLHFYRRHPLRPVRRLALRRAAEWIIARQEADGSWGGIQPPWVYSIMALHLLGYPLAHPVLQAGLRGLDGFLIHEDTPHGRCAAWRPASPRSGTPRWPSSACSTRASPRTARLCGGPPTGCWARRSRLPATGRCAGRISRPAAGRSSSPTTCTPTSTTPRRWGWRCAGWPTPTRTERAARCGGPGPGLSACSPRTAAGAPSTPTTPANWPTSCRSVTSGR